MVEVNIYYQRYKERIEIDIIRDQRQSVISRVSQLAHYNAEINWRTGEVKMTRCPEKYRKQQRPKQGKLEQQNQKKEKKKKKRERNKKGKSRRKKKKKEKTKERKDNRDEKGSRRIEDLR